ncbi:MAG: hypothetical protein M1812_000563 [Candelaria pacifica]|nr:MAG: hypothetical protein M1812_000563 [Candelaria pacifica]
MSTTEHPKTANSPPTNHPISFSSLPGEIRNKIYRNLLLFTPPSNEVINIRSRSTMPTHKNESSSPQYSNLVSKPDLAILRTNKKIHKEASSIFYSSNRFLTHITPFPVNDDNEDNNDAHDEFSAHEIIPSKYWTQIGKISIIISSTYKPLSITNISNIEYDNEDEIDTLTEKLKILVMDLSLISNLNELNVFVNDCNIFCTHDEQFEPGLESVWPFRYLKNSNIIVRYFDLSLSPIIFNDGNDDDGDGGKEVFLKRYQTGIRHPAGFPILTREERDVERGRRFEKMMGCRLTDVEGECRRYRAAAWVELGFEH